MQLMASQAPCQSNSRRMANRLFHSRTAGPKPICSYSRPQRCTQLPHSQPQSMSQLLPPSLLGKPSRSCLTAPAAQALRQPVLNPAATQPASVDAAAATAQPTREAKPVMPDCSCNPGSQVASAQPFLPAGSSGVQPTVTPAPHSGTHSGGHSSGLAHRLSQACAH